MTDSRPDTAARDGLAPGALILRDVTKRYDGVDHPAVDHVTLTTESGEAMAVIGPSGSGKATLLNLIAGLDKPTSGVVMVAGKRVDRMGETGVARFRRREIGMIFQFFNLLEDLTVQGNVLLPAQLAGVRRGQARGRAGVLLERLGIEQYRDSYPGRLSGGECERVAIARAVVNSIPARSPPGRDLTRPRRPAAAAHGRAWLNEPNASKHLRLAARQIPGHARSR